MFLEDLVEIHEPTLLGVERVFHSRNVQTALAVGHARGVVLLAAAEHGMDVREATPSEVKIAVTGYGSADKGQVARMVQAVLELPEVPHPDDAADALAIAVWASHREPAGERLNAGVLDRAAAAPRRHEETPYERAIRRGDLARAADARALGRHAVRHRRRPPESRGARPKVGEARPRSGTPAPRGPGRARRRGAGRTHSMIASLDGTVGSVGTESLVLEVGGVGYRVFVAPMVLVAAPVGGRLKLHTHHLFREDLQALYGFRTAEELGFFGLLLTVTGVGPKVALSILGSRPVPDLQLAIMADDQAVLTAVSGVGKRLAARIVLELREKVTAAGIAAATLPAGGAGGVAGIPESEVVAALQALGYTLAEAREGARAALSGAAQGTLEERVKAALRAMSAG